MPTVANLDGVKIVIHNGDHRPPHIHAIYSEYETLIEVETMKAQAGYLPAKQLKKAIDWLTGNQELALSVFYELNPQLK
jgi:hypothetical protein